MQEIFSLFLSQLSRQKESECQCNRVCQNMPSPTPEPYDWIEKSLWHSLDLLLCAHVKISPLCFFAIGCVLRACVVVTTPPLSRSHTSNLNSIHLLPGSRLSGFRKSRLEGSTYVVDECCHFCLNVQYETIAVNTNSNGNQIDPKNAQLYSRNEPVYNLVQKLFWSIKCHSKQSKIFS